MTGDRSLDEFVPDDPADDERDGTEGERDAGSEGDDPDAEGATVVGDEAAGVEPIEPTTDFSPDGTACEACGAVVERRWRDGDAMVCADCKSW